MTSADEARPGTSSTSASAPHPVALVLRPLGYAAFGTVWAVIWLAALAIYPGSMAYLALDDPEAVVTNMTDVLTTPVQAVAVVCLLVPLVAAVMGPAALWFVPTACWPLMTLCWVYAGRALRRGYRHEKLSYTTWSAPGQTFGPPTVTGVAMSLQPVRRSRTTDVLMRYYVAGWNPDGRMFLAMLPAGLAWTSGVVALLDGVPPPARVAAGVVTVLLLALSAVLGVRAFRGRTTPAVDHRRASELSGAERAARLHELRRRRDTRRRSQRFTRR